MFKTITLLGLVLVSPSTMLATNIQLDIASLVDDLMDTSNIIKKQINLSGKQRMLTQRMTKLGILISLNINLEENKKKLLQFSKSYNKALKSFKGGDNKKINQQISLIEKEWKPFLKNVEIIVEGKDNDGKSLSYLIEYNEKLLNKSNVLVDLYEKSNTSQNYMEKAMNKIINIAGRQRMLTQKMTKEKLLCIKGKSENNFKLKKTVKLFDDSLILLMKGNIDQNISKPSNKKIKNQLEKVALLWKKLKPIYKKEKLEVTELALIIQENPILLKEMNLMVEMVESETEY